MLHHFVPVERHRSLRLSRVLRLALLPHAGASCGANVRSPTTLLWQNRCHTTQQVGTTSPHHTEPAGLEGGHLQSHLVRRHLPPRTSTERMSGYRSRYLVPTTTMGETRQEGKRKPTRSILTSVVSVVQVVSDVLLFIRSLCASALRTNKPQKKSHDTCKTTS